MDGQANGRGTNFVTFHEILMICFEMFHKFFTIPPKFGTGRGLDSTVQNGRPPLSSSLSLSVLVAFGAGELFLYWAFEAEI